MKNLIYHYTSIQTLYSIIENQSIWLTDLWSSMDKKEMSYAQKLISEEGKKVLGKSFPFLAPARNYYSFSCTHNADSYFHFNCYADNCLGVAIGIDQNFLESGVPTKECLEMVSYHLYFADVKYNIKEQKQMIEKNIKDKNPFFNLINDQSLTKTYNRCFALIKRPEFEQEQEVRLIYRQDYGGSKTLIKELNDGKKFVLNDFLNNVGLEVTSQCYEPKKVKYFCFKNRIRKYYEFSLKPFGMNNVIKSITIGPKSQQNINELKEYLLAHNINAQVKKSKIELRN